MKENFLKRFLRKWNVSLQKDKQQHFRVGFYSTLIMTLVLGVFGLRPALFYLLCLIWMCLVGYGIEFAQSFTKDRYSDFLDAYATVAGGVLALIIRNSLYEIISFLL